MKRKGKRNLKAIEVGTMQPDPTEKSKLLLSTSSSKSLCDLEVFMREECR